MISTTRQQWIENISGLILLKLTGQLQVAIRIRRAARVKRTWRAYSESEAKTSVPGLLPQPAVPESILFTITEHT
jgi:hypothetical protein